MSDFDENLAPAPAPDVDPQSLDTSPTAEEYFILSRLDGSITIGQLCKTSGLGTDKTMQCIENLRRHGLIQIPGASSDEPTSSEADQASSSSDASTSSASAKKERAEGDSDDTPSKDEKKQSLAASIRRRFPQEFSDFDFDEALMEQQVELDDDFKRELLFVHAQLGDVDHYELLGVDRDIKRRGLRRAYFPMSKRYHPDRFYKKITGDFEPLVQTIFERITAAYQTLSDRNKRAEYDAALERGQSSHDQAPRGSTPASRRSETRENIMGDRKRNMAFRVLVQRGDKALGQNRVALALKEYRKALGLQPDLELSLRIARRLLDDDVHLDDAVSFARTAHKIDPDAPEPLKLIGAIYEQKGAIDDALYHYEMALEAAPDDRELSARLAELNPSAEP